MKNIHKTFHAIVSIGLVVDNVIQRKSGITINVNVTVIKTIKHHVSQENYASNSSLRVL